MFKELKRIFRKEAPVPTILIGQEDISGETQLDRSGAVFCICWGEKLRQFIEGLDTLAYYTAQVSPDGNYIVLILEGDKIPGVKEYGPHGSSRGFNFTRWEVTNNVKGASMRFYQDYEDNSEYFIVKGDFRVQPLLYEAPHQKPERWELPGSGGVINVKTFRFLDREKLWPWLKDHYPPPKVDYPLRLPSVIKKEIFSLPGFLKRSELTSRFQFV